MTVSTTTRKQIFEGNDLATSFAFAFKVFEDTDLQAILITAAGAESVLTQGVDYTVAVNADQNVSPGGSVTYPVTGDPLPAGATLTLTTALAASQETDLVNASGFFPETIEDRLDYITILAQQLGIDLARAPLVSIGDAAPNLSLGTAVKRASTYMSFDADGDVQFSQTAIPTTAFTQENVGDVLFPETPAETASGVEPETYRLADPYDVRRAGVVPNSALAAAANSAALIKLFDPANTGITGKVIFPNSTGSDVYHFDDFIEIRDGVRIDLCGSTLKFTRVYDAADDTKGFLTAIRDVAIENGFIDVDYDGSAGTAAGMVIRIGGREGYGFAGAANINDEDFATPMGNVRLRNLRVSSNNPSTKAILMLGGLRGVVCENIFIDGQGALGAGIYYEFGHYHFETTVANRTTSHAAGLELRNIHVQHLDTTLANADAVSLIGCWSAKVSGLYADTVAGAFVFRPSEALFYNPGETDLAGLDRAIVLENIVGNNLTSTAITLTGAESASGGYLADEGLTESEQTDLMSFSLNGFAVDGSVLVSGALDLRNGGIVGAGASGGLIMTDECVQFAVENVRILDGAGMGIRASFGSAIFATPRKKVGSIKNCFIAGNTGIGVSIGNADNVLVESCRIGYELTHDGVAETTQTNAVSLQTTVDNGVIKNTHVGGVSAGDAYVLGGVGPRGCAIQNCSGITTASGIWEEVIGTWTPTLLAGTSGSITLDPATSGGRFVKRGRVVHVDAYLDVQSIDAPVGALSIGGLPFAVANVVWARTPLAIRGTGLGTSSDALMVWLVHNTLTAQIYTRYAAGSAVTDASDITAATFISVSGTYFVDG